MSTYNRNNEFEKYTLPKFLRFYSGNKKENAVIIQEVLYIDVQK